jgi:hypothetical protein
MVIITPWKIAENREDFKELLERGFVGFRKGRIISSLPSASRP